MPTSCRSCGEPIFWAKTAGKPIPVNVTPTVVGNLVRTRDGGVVIVDQATGHALRQEGTETYVSHFATCRDASGWRRATDDDAARRGD